MNIKYIALFSLAFVAPSIVAFSIKLDALEDAKRAVERTRQEAKQSQTKSRAELLDESREALRICRKTNKANPIVRIFGTENFEIFGCATLEKNYHEAKNNFLAPFEPYVEEGTLANNTLQEVTEVPLYNLPIIGNTIEKLSYRQNAELVSKVLLGMGSSAIKVVLQDEKPAIFNAYGQCEIERDCFLNNNLPTATIAENAIHESLKYIDTTVATQERTNAAKETLMKTVQS